MIPNKEQELPPSDHSPGEGEFVLFSTWEISLGNLFVKYVFTFANLNLNLYARIGEKDSVLQVRL